MRILSRALREPALILGVVAAIFGVLVVFGVDLTKEQIGAINVLIGALIALLRFILTPSSEVVAQMKPFVGIVPGKAATGDAGKHVRMMLMDQDNQEE